MVILGILLIILAVAAILAGVFLNDGSAELLGVAMSSTAIFLVGVVAGALLLWGISLVKWGTKRSMARRREKKELSRLSEKLDRVEADRRDDGDSSSSTSSRS